MSSIKRRALVIKPSRGPGGNINVTPLIDIVLVLLIIFMVITPMLEQDIFVQVPATEQAEAPEDVPPDQLVVRVAQDGALYLNERAIETAKYVETLRKRLRSRARSQKVVFVTAEDEAPYGLLVTALDGARQAGAVALGFAADDPPDVAAGAAPTEAAPIP